MLSEHIDRGYASSTSAGYLLYKALSGLVYIFRLAEECKSELERMLNEESKLREIE